MGITLSKQGRHEQYPLLGWAPALQTLTPALKNMGHLNPMYIHARDYPKKQARITPMRIFRYRSHLLPCAVQGAGSASHLVPSAPPLLSPWVSRQDLPSADTVRSPWLPLLMSPHQPARCTPSQNALGPTHLSFLSPAVPAKMLQGNPQ